MSTKQTVPFAAAAAVAVLMVAAGASAGVIHDNGGPDWANGIVSDTGCADCPTGVQFAGENFTLASSTRVTDVFWSGGYFPGDITHHPDSFTIAFFDSVPHRPEIAPFYSETVGVTRTDSGVDLLGVSIFHYAATIPSVSLEPGDYLISIFNDTPGNADSWLWATTGTWPPRSFYRFDTVSGWSRVGSEHAFRLEGVMDVPEPGTLALLSLGLAGLGLARGRRRWTGLPFCRRSG